MPRRIFVVQDNAIADDRTPVPGYLGCVAADDVFCAIALVDSHPDQWPCKGEVVTRLIDLFTPEERVWIQQRLLDAADEADDADDEEDAPRKPPCPLCGKLGGLNQVLRSGTPQYRCYACDIVWTRPEDRKSSGRPKGKSGDEPEKKERQCRYAIVDMSRGFQGKGLWRTSFVGVITARSRGYAMREIRKHPELWPLIQDIEEVKVLPWRSLKAKERRWATEASNNVPLSLFWESGTLPHAKQK